MGEQDDGIFGLVINVDNPSNVMNAFVNGQTVTFKFTDNKDLVLGQTDVDNVDTSSGIVTLSSSGNTKTEVCFSDVVTRVDSTELYFDDITGAIDIIIYGE